MSNVVLELVSIPTVGCASAIVSANVVLPYLGRSFMQVSPHSMLLVGIIGAVHHFATPFISAYFSKNDQAKEVFKFTPLLIGSTVVAAFLLGLTTLAAKVNLISGGLSLAGASALVVTGVVGNILLVNALYCNCLPKKSRPSSL